MLCKHHLPARQNLISQITIRIRFCTNLGHFQVSKLVPQILNGVDANQGGTEQADHLDTADTANAQAGQEKPREPLQREALVLQPVESRPAKNGGERKAEEHRVE